MKESDLGYVGTPSQVPFHGCQEKYSNEILLRNNMATKVERPDVGIKGHHGQI